jgi:hemerythrin
MSSKSDTPPQSKGSAEGSDRLPEARISRLEGEHARIAEMLEKATQALMRHASPSEINVILLDLGGYTLSHFREEEEIMSSSGYPGVEAHKQEHEQLVSYVRGLLDLHPRQEALRGAMSVLDQWLEIHIRVTDKKLFNFLQIKGL